MTSMNVVQEWQLVHSYVVILMVAITVAVATDINWRTMGLTVQVGAISVCCYQKHLL